MCSLTIVFFFENFKMDRYRKLFCYCWFIFNFVESAKKQDSTDMPKRKAKKKTDKNIERAK